MPRIYKPAAGPPSNKAANPVEEVKTQTPAKGGKKPKDDEKKGDGQ